MKFLVAQAVFSFCLFGISHQALANDTSFDEGSETRVLFDSEESVSPFLSRTILGSKACQAANISEEQKAKIQQIIADMRTQKRELRKEVRAAKKAYVAVLRDSNSTVDAAQSAGDMITAAVTKLIALRMSTSTNILYNVLTPSQRVPGYFCHKAMQRAKMKSRLEMLCKAR